MLFCGASEWWVGGQGSLRRGRVSYRAGVSDLDADTSDELHRARHGLKRALRAKRGCDAAEARRIAEILDRGRQNSADLTPVQHSGAEQVGRSKDHECRSQSFDGIASSGTNTT
jgi:hypothetical protein